MSTRHFRDLAPFIERDVSELPKELTKRIDSWGGSEELLLLCDRILKWSDHHYLEFHVSKNVMSGLTSLKESDLKIDQAKTDLVADNIEPWARLILKLTRLESKRDRDNLLDVWMALGFPVTSSGSPSLDDDQLKKDSNNLGDVLHKLSQVRNKVGHEKYTFETIRNKLGLKVQDSIRYHWWLAFLGPILLLENPEDLRSKLGYLKDVKDPDLPAEFREFRTHIQAQIKEHRELFIGREQDLKNLKMPLNQSIKKDPQAKGLFYYLCGDEENGKSALVSHLVAGYKEKNIGPLGSDEMCPDVDHCPSVVFLPVEKGMRVQDWVLRLQQTLDLLLLEPPKLISQGSLESDFSESLDSIDSALNPGEYNAQVSGFGTQFDTPDSVTFQRGDRTTKSALITQLALPDFRSAAPSKVQNLRKKTHYRSVFKKTIEALSKERRRSFLIIDGLDEFQDSAEVRELIEGLPEAYSARVAVLISARNGTRANQFLEKKFRVMSHSKLMNLKKLGNEPAAQKIREITQDGASEFVIGQFYKIIHTGGFVQPIKELMKNGGCAATVQVEADKSEEMIELWKDDRLLKAALPVLALFRSIRSLKLETLRKLMSLQPDGSRDSELYQQAGRGALHDSLEKVRHHLDGFSERSYRLRIEGLASYVIGTGWSWTSDDWKELQWNFLQIGLNDDLNLAEQKASFLSSLLLDYSSRSWAESKIPYDFPEPLFSSFRSETDGFLLQSFHIEAICDALNSKPDHPFLIALGKFALLKFPTTSGSNEKNPYKLFFRVFALLMSQEVDLTDTLMRFTALAKTEDPDAMFILGLLLLVGDGFDQDLEEGRSWLRKAADTEHPQSMFFLGQRLLEGDGFDQDLEQGRSWLRKAAETEDPQSMRILGQRLLEGKGFDQDLEEGRSWLRKAADTEDPQSMFFLGQRLLEGDGFEQDLEEGRTWLKKAATSGNTEAKLRINNPVTQSLPKPGPASPRHKPQSTYLSMAIGLALDWMRKKVTKSEFQSTIKELKHSENFQEDIKESHLNLLVRSTYLELDLQNTQLDQHRFYLALLLLIDYLTNLDKEEEIHNSVFYCLRRGYILNSPAPNLTSITPTFKHQDPGSLDETGLVNHVLAGLQSGHSVPELEDLIQKMTVMPSWWILLANKGDHEGHFVLGWVQKICGIKDPAGWTTEKRWQAARVGGSPLVNLVEKSSESE